MSTPVPDAVKRLVDARDMTEMSDISDRVPGRPRTGHAREVFLSSDHEEEQLRLELLSGHILAVRRSAFPWPLLRRARLEPGADRALDLAERRGYIDLKDDAEHEGN